MSSPIAFRHVTKAFGAHKALDDVSFEVEAGSFVTVLGPSGSGKSTTLRILAGFEQPDEGRVELDGRDITDQPPERRDINTVFQDYALFPHMSVAQNVAFGLKAKGVPKGDIEGRVTEALGMVRLPGFGLRSVAGLSGGEQQRVALARAFVNRPKLLLLDEPLSALDLKLRRQMQTELKQLQKRLGLTFVYVTHDQEEALSMSDRIIVINRARIEQVGTPAEVYRRPATVFVADFLGGSNILSGSLEGRDNAGALIRCRNLLLKAPDANGHALGSALSFCLRSEDVLLGPDARLSDNTTNGQVVSAIFLGSAWEYGVAVDGQTLRVWRPVDHDETTYDVDQPVEVGWQRAKLVPVA